MDFIPCGESEYFIFDKEKKSFLGKFSIQDLRNAKREPIFSEAEFSAAAVEVDWNWGEVISTLAEAKHRKIYAVCHDIKRAASFCKIPELEEYMDQVWMFPGRDAFQEYFHKNTAIYLPLIVVGNETAASQLKQILEKEHQYRLTPKGRSMENVLLTIGIPTHARGHLLLKRLEHLRAMPYDAEIEIAISKNGDELYQQEYEEASRIADARINYYDHGCTIEAARNWIHVVNMAHGKYVLLVSDEDDVVLGALEHYLKLLMDNPEVSLARAKTVFQFGHIKERFYEKKGPEAFRREVFGQNYLSGLIFRREDFVRENFIQLESFSENAFYKNYPHEWWCARLSQTGDYLEEPFILIREGDSIFEEEMAQAREQGTLQESDGMEKAFSLPVYATYEARLEQFSGMIGFIRWIAGENQTVAAIALIGAVLKTGGLLKIAREFGKYDDERLENVLNDFCCIAIRAVDEILTDEMAKKNVLERLKAAYIFLKCMRN
ncbi:MAG: glycosyltransferase [Lachnospiraceae bacterium]|nr:glycosyltransferase [Lachnospiraceae bacterium]